ncbi:MAG: glycosyltransferase [Verrucomicrobia bacterium]|nr:glycosyltransferase [Verrucomicrobiota bacterium]
MKIAFITGGLKPGADGVGDYSDHLAAEVTRLGHECALLSINDWGVERPTFETRGAPGALVRALRLPHTLGWPARLAAARGFLDTFGPAWVSLQFVAYAFDPRGIAKGLAPHLAPLVAGRKLHVFLHELWIGLDASARLKERVIGGVQRRHVLHLLRKLRPTVLHTNTPTYVSVLARHRLRASALPLFGNVPVTNERADAWLFPALKAAGLDISAANREAFRLFGFFGSLHEVWPPEPLLARLREAGAAQGKKSALISVGRLGPGEALWNRMAREYAKTFTFLKLGPRTAREVSQFLNTVDFGIATSPLGLINKSGSVAAMLDHDLPVIVNREDPRRHDLDREPLEGFGRFLRLDAQFAARLAAARTRRPEARLAQTARSFLDALGAPVSAAAAARPEFAPVH